MLNNRNPTILLGDARIPLFENQDGAHPLTISGIAWSCPYCGKQWARLEGTATNPRISPWLFPVWPCLDHTQKAHSNWLRGGAVLPYIEWHFELFLFHRREDLIQSLSGLIRTYEASTRIHQILKEYP